MPSLVEKTAQYVRLKLLNEPTGHDWYHVERVWRLAKELQAEGGGNLEVIELAALLHELGDDQVFEFSDSKGNLVLNGMMDVLEIDEPLKTAIIKIIDECQYGGEHTRSPSTLEGQIVRDADWLDDLGALGIARVFATGGYIKRAFHDPTKPARQKLSRELHHRTKREGTSLNYFYEKMFYLPRLMNIPRAKALAEERLVYTKQFIDEFLQEWEGKR